MVVDKRRIILNFEDVATDRFLMLHLDGPAPTHKWAALTKLSVQSGGRYLMEDQES